MRTVAGCRRNRSRDCGAARARHGEADGRRRRDHRDAAPRERIFLAQTPQAFRVDVLRDALALAAGDATDEATLAERAGTRCRSWMATRET